MRNEYDNIEKDIIDAMKSITIEDLQELSWGNLTKMIKCKLHDVGCKWNCEVQASGLGDDTITEWVFDLTWLQLDEERKLKSVVLAVESEWDRKHKNIQDDFEKLLLTNAEHRLMICSPKTENIKELKEYFKQAIDNYKLLNKNDRFLIAIFDDCGSGVFEFNLIKK